MSKPLSFSLVGLTAAIALAPGLSSCTALNQDTNKPYNLQGKEVTQAKKQGKKKVVTTFTILADMARNIGEDKLIVESITRIGAEVHGYEPTPSDLTRVENADLILYNGMNLERWFEKFYRNLGDVPSVLVSEGIQPIPIRSGPYENQPNPHAWMSPRNALIYVENIRRALVKLDPDNAKTYNAKAAAYGQKLKALDRELQENLKNLSGKERYLVTCEGAFSYLAHDYGLQEIYLWPINAEQQSTPQQITRAIEKVKSNAVPAVFCESTVSSEGQKEVAKATGAKFAGNLYVDSLSTSSGPVPTYLDLLTYDVRTISNGLAATPK